MHPNERHKLKVETKYWKAVFHSSHHYCNKCIHNDRLQFRMNQLASFRWLLLVGIVLFKSYVSFFMDSSAFSGASKRCYGQSFAPRRALLWQVWMSKHYIVRDMGTLKRKISIAVYPTKWIHSTCVCPYWRILNQEVPLFIRRSIDWYREMSVTDTRTRKSWKLFPFECIKATVDLRAFYKFSSSPTWWI